MPLITIKDLTFAYSGTKRPAIKDVSLSIDSGEFILLVGPSGCGKSTLCRCMNGLIPHFYSGDMKGEVEVVGRSITETPTYTLSQHVGFVFQNPENQLFALSVENDVAFALENLGYPREEMKRRVDFALRAVGIESLRSKSPFELSGGQKQKVAIASILAMQPKIMILDEPTSFLDPMSAETLIETISDIRDQTNLTVVLVEHRLDLASRHATRILVMNNGMLVKDGRPDQILAEEETEVLGVGIPKVVQLTKILNRRLPRFRGTPLAIEEASAKIRGLLK